MSCTMRLLQDFKEGKRLIIFSIEKLIVVEYILYFLRIIIELLLLFRI